MKKTLLSIIASAALLVGCGGEEKDKNKDPRNYAASYEVKRGEDLFGYEDSDRVIFTHPIHPEIVINNSGSYVEKISRAIKGTRENMDQVISILTDELKRGWISPQNAFKAKGHLEQALQNYVTFKALYQYLGKPGGVFKREVDYFNPNVWENIVQTRRKDTKLFPGYEVREFVELAKKYQLDKSKNGMDDNIGKPITGVLEELDEVIKRQEQVKLTPRRYVPIYGFGERIDELVNPEVGDTWECLITVGAVLLSVAGIGGYLGYRSYKKGQNKQKEDQQSPELKPILGEPPAEIIDPWGIKLLDDTRQGEKR